MDTKRRRYPTGRLVPVAFILGLVLSPPATAQTARRVPEQKIRDFLAKIPDKDSAWALNRSRDALDRPAEIIRMLEVEPGMTIGEAGAGAGYFTFFLSEAVGEEGTVYANDNDEYMLAALEFYAKEFGALKNIIPILGLDDDPCFPSRHLDMIVIYGSFHDFTQRDAWLRNANAYLRPMGKLVIVDGYYPHHGGLTFEYVRDYGVRAGFKLLLHEDLSRDSRSHHVHVFVK
jgi:SAM-dependent methyltransferase